MPCCHIFADQNDQGSATKRRGDTLLVAKLTGEAAWTKSFTDACQDWLRTNLKKA
jgi:hypothetical protein